MIKTVDLTKQYDDRIAVKNLNLSVEPGEAIGAMCVALID